jgi:hypothetical protein
VAFVTADGVRHAEGVPVRLSPLVAWGDGIRIAPYLRVLERQGVTAVAVVDSRAARVYALHDGELHDRGALHAHAASGPVSHMGDAPAPGFHAGTRGTTGTDAAERARLVGRARMLDELAERLVEVAGPHGWIVVGGIPEVAAAAVERLPDAARGRARALAGLDVHATPAQVAGRAAEETTRLRREAAMADVEMLVARHAGGGTAAIRRDGVLEALRERAVDRLDLSERLLDDDAPLAERIVREAFDQDAQVSCVDGPAAARLDAEAQGLVAQLRFVPTRGQPPVAAPPS